MEIRKKLKVSRRSVEVVNLLKKNGYQAWIVGGAVRDLVMGREVGDYDITTDARPEQVKKCFYHVIPTGIEHGTVTVLYKKKSFEVTTYRSDGSYSDSRHPDSVAFSDSLSEDLKRRDFTINALAYDPSEGVLVDEYDGLADIEGRMIRTIGKAAERFTEDALRMIRACRFASQLGFQMEDRTADSIRELAANIDNISIERIREEFIKIILSPVPSVGIEYLRTCSLLPHVLPELADTWGVAQNRFHTYDVYYHTMHVVDSFRTDDYRVRLAGLLHDIGKPATRREVDGKEEPVFYNHEIVGGAIARKLLRRMKFSKNDIKFITHLVRNHMFHYTPEWTDGAIRRFVKKIDEENLSFLFQLREADRLGNGKRAPDCEELKELRARIKDILAQDAALKISDLRIDGTVLMNKLDIGPSRMIGDILKYLLEEVLEDPGNNNEARLLELAEVYYRQHREVSPGN